MNVDEKLDCKKKSNEIKEIDNNAETDKKMKNYKEKVDVNGNLMNNRVYSTGICRNVEVVEAEMKISDGELFFVTKACDRRSKNVPRKANTLSFCLENLNIKSKDHELSYPLYCAWYRPECSLQG